MVCCSRRGSLPGYGVRSRRLRGKPYHRALRPAGPVRPGRCGPAQPGLLGPAQGETARAAEQPIPSPPGDNSGIHNTLGYLPQPCLEVAPQRNTPQVVPEPSNLGYSPKARGPHGSPGRQVRDGIDLVPANQGVSDAFPSGYRRYYQAGGMRGGKVFQAMHGNIRPTCKQRLFNLAGKIADRVGLVQEIGSVAVALGCELHDGSIKLARQPFEEPADIAGLNQGQLAGPAGDPDSPHLGLPKNLKSEGSLWGDSTVQAQQFQVLGREAGIEIKDFII